MMVPILFCLSCLTRMALINLFLFRCRCRVYAFDSQQIHTIIHSLSFVLSSFHHSSPKIHTRRQLMLQGDFIWEEGDGADEEEFKMNLPKKLSQLPCGGIQHGTVLEIDDNSQSLNVCVTITHKDEWDGDEAPEDFPFVVGALPPKKKDDVENKPAAGAVAVSSTEPTKLVDADNNDDDDDMVLIIDEDEAKIDTVKNGDKKMAAKRSIDENADGENPTKKAKTEPSKEDNDVEVIEIED